MNWYKQLSLAALAVAITMLLSPTTTHAQSKKGNGIGPSSTTDAASMVSGLSNWQTEPLFTVGEIVEGYQPPGILDGIGAVALDHRTVRVFVNHELTSGAGYPYTLANGATLTGARVSLFDIHRTSKKLITAGPAYDTIYDRAGDVVTDASQLGGGINRLCSAALFVAGEYGLVDDIFFTGEETGGGTEFALDAQGGVLYAAPWLGVAAWESVTMVDTGNPNTVGIVVGDDRAAAPLILYVGQKNAIGDGSFLDRNGLAQGSLYVWVADNGDTTPQDWSGTGTNRMGTFVQVAHYDDPSDGVPAGYDALGFATQSTQDALAAAANAFQFSRPEDVSTNPENGTQVVMASTGRGGLFPADNWGTTYLIDIEFGSDITADISVLYDGDDAGNGQFTGPDYGLRSPDNLDWADDGMIYLQEDRSTSPGSLFGGTSGEEASIWQLDPMSGKLTRIGQVDRTAVPAGQSDPSPNDIGNWETSGILDVTDLFLTKPGERLLILDAQAHSLRDGVIASANLVQGGQLLFMSSRDWPQVAGNGIGKRAGDVETAGDVTPTSFTLDGNHPNPFNPTTSISFTVPEAADVSIAVYDVLGRQVGHLLNGGVEAGSHTVRFDAGSLPSGSYLVRMTTPQGAFTRTISLLK